MALTRDTPFVTRRRARLHPRIAILLAALSAIAVAALPSRAEPLSYRIDPARSEFVVQVFKAGVGATLAHDHVVRATAYAGRIEADPADPTTTSTSIAVEVESSSLMVDEPMVRQKYGLETQLGETQREQVQTTMESESQLAVARYPVMRFDSTRVERGRHGDFAVTGELTIRGVTRSIEFPVRAEQRDGAVHAWGSFRFKQTDFGFQPYSALLGAVRTQDEVVLHFDVVATP